MSGRSLVRVDDFSCKFGQAGKSCTLPSSAHSVLGYDDAADDEPGPLEVNLGDGLRGSVRRWFKQRVTSSPKGS
jgi:hypothetical protein